MKQAINDKKNAEQKLRKIEVESIHVQENLQVKPLLKNFAKSI